MFVDFLLLVDCLQSSKYKRQNILKIVDHMTIIDQCNQTSCVKQNPGNGDYHIVAWIPNI